MPRNNGPNPYANRDCASAERRRRTWRGEFLALKDCYDPDGVFSSDWHQTYRNVGRGAPACRSENADCSPEC